MKGCCPENRSSCDIPAIERSNLSTNEVRHAFSYPISVWMNDNVFDIVIWYTSSEWRSKEDGEREEWGW